MRARFVAWSLALGPSKHISSVIIREGSKCKHSAVYRERVCLPAADVADNTHTHTHTFRWCNYLLSVHVVFIVVIMQTIRTSELSHILLSNDKPAHAS